MLWSLGGENAKINWVFPQHKMNSKVAFREKGQGFDNKKPNWNALWRKIEWPKQTRGETHWQLHFYLNFRSYFEAAGPYCFNVFWKILLQSIFLARSILWPLKRVQKQWIHWTGHLGVKNWRHHCKYRPNNTYEVLRPFCRSVSSTQAIRIDKG